MLLTSKRMYSAFSSSHQIVLTMYTPLLRK